MDIIMSSPTHDFQLPLRIVDNGLRRLHGTSTSVQETNQWSPTLTQRPAVCHLHPAPATNAAPVQALSAKTLNLSGERDASLTVPESQDHWEAKKQIIRRLYMIDNRPLKELRDLMMRRHLFHATERMYKRQFVKWGWKKYNTKGLQDGLVERPPGKATCRRPPRRRMIRVFDDNVDILYFASNLPVMLNHGSNLDRMKHAIFNSQRDLVYGTSRRDPEWMERRFETITTVGYYTRDMFSLAHDLFESANVQEAWAVLRHGFCCLESAVDDDPVDLFTPLFLDAPYYLSRDFLDKKLLGEYYRQLYQLLKLKRPNEPITLIAMTFSNLEAEELPHLWKVIEEMHKIMSNLYNEVLGEDDPRSLQAEKGLLYFEDDIDERSKQCDRISSNFELLLARTIGQFGQLSVEAFDVELRQVLTFVRSVATFGPAMVLYDRYLTRVRLVTADKPLEEWRLDILDGYQIVKYYIGLLQIESGGLEAGIAALKDSIVAAECALSRAKGEMNRRGYAYDILGTRHGLANILDEHGRHNEAEEVRAAIASSEYLETIVQNDLGENFEEYVRFLC